ncbi:MAG: mannose-1-phosphate guanylyltransferase [Clostridia bacterium]|nr:mannose-1-phosphate guanylyltransferase [Clostridia bacterium]
MKVFAVIMAGGGGTRFWPASRIKRPKQLLDLSGKGIMINQTADRLKKLLPEDTYVVTAKEQAEGVLSATCGRVNKNNVIAEPFAKNTAACIGYAAIRIIKEHGDGIMVVSPSDAYVKDEEGYVKTLNTAIKFAADGKSLVTIGIKPTFPATGYGYIKLGEGKDVKKVVEFVEKPDRKTAEEYVKCGNYLWNSGVFVWTAKAVMGEIKKYIPELYAALTDAFDKVCTESESVAIEKAYNKIPSVSIDYGVMEKTENAFVAEGDFGWSDVGSFDTLGTMIGEDENKNVIRGNAITSDTQNSVIYSEKRLIATLGVKDLIIVETDDAVLVCDKARAQEIKNIVEKLKEKGLNNLI